MHDSNLGASGDKKSDTIRAELAKYKMLKNQALGISEEPRESKRPVRSNVTGIGSPSKGDALKDDGPATLYSNYSSLATTNSSKNERQSSAKKAHNQTSQSLRQHEESPLLYSSEPRLNKADSTMSQSSSSVRELANTLNYNPKPKTPGVSRSNTSVSSGALKKNAANNKSIGAITDKKKDLTWAQIEDFVDMDIERDLVSKGSKTSKSEGKELRSSATFSKLNSAPLNTDKNSDRRAASSLENYNKDLRNSREFKNRTPTSIRLTESDEKNPKEINSSSPEPYIVENYKMRKTLPTSSTEPNTRTSNKDNKDIRSVNAILGRNISPRSAVNNLKPVEEFSERGLRDEVAKWRVFGKMMAESYDDLNRKYTNYLNDKGQDKKIIDILKEQVSTLKSLLKESKDENGRLKDLSARTGKSNTFRNTEEDYDPKEQPELHKLSQELDGLRHENSEIMKMVEFLKDENEIMKKSIEDGVKYRELAERYQKLADARFKECSALAEEIICLRTDLDRSHSNYLRIQREQSSGKKLNSDIFNSGNKASQDQKGGANNAGGLSRYKKWNDKQVSQWTEDLDDLPPLPTELVTLPSKEETSHIDN